MTELEQLREYEALLIEQMDELGQVLIDVRSQIAVLAANEDDQLYWVDPMEEAGTLSYTLKALTRAFGLFRNGNRDEYHYSFLYAPFEYRFVATLTDDVSPANKAHYVRATNQYLPRGMLWNTKREGPILAEVYDEDNQQIEGLYIPFASSVEGAVRNSTIELREYWNKDSTIQFHRQKANMRMRSLDREYLLAKIRGTVDEFDAKYPFYIDKDSWSRG